MAKIVIDKCNIFKQRCQLVLHDGEHECEYCQGHGGFFISSHAKDRHWSVRECIMCLGEGKVDWISATNKVAKAIHAKVIQVGMKCPSSRGHKCKVMKRLWKQKKMKYEISMWQEY
jgi:hypothetical protein